ncbi:hypothetical protein VA7868_01346 [Vibrio aerogenes CECT 7868]|uniref:DUF72 domain-containing protein n=1 Tax=Vibrio aerogenes CECT 7868 TaxID=1216006 RepID=A0A1M5XVI7_9VIBR|nr:DUF72 domain-containing protein [Vibrio aerogenes]SHI03837.1 hypothetical protein VA7868_01346 [Vibrio aerogenes CECT 7868]
MQKLQTKLPLRLGLTLWSHPQWQQTFYGRGTTASERLEKYAQVFHTVEGNTTFYASPASKTVSNWKAATHDDFRFTFKLPKEITHELMLTGCRHALHTFLTLLEPIHERIGLWTIQLPAAFGPEFFPRLQQFCQLFPAHFPLGVEIRHPAFFTKGPEEKTLNQWLIEQKINRIIMDSRPVFAAPPETPATIDAQRKKPRLPVHAIATAGKPMMRFIGHPALNENHIFFQPWLNKLTAWIHEGRQPYVMIHTPDNALAPELAQQLYQSLQQKTALPDLAAFPAMKEQNQLPIFPDEFS